MQSEAEGIAMEWAMREGMESNTEAFASLALGAPRVVYLEYLKLQPTGGSCCHYDNKLRLLSFSPLKD